MRGKGVPWVERPIHDDSASIVIMKISGNFFFHIDLRQTSQWILRLLIPSVFGSAIVER
jgi:hypothetical protein